MTDKKKFLRLESLISYVQSESDGDEIYIKHNDQKIAPAEGRYIKMSRGVPVALDVEVDIADTETWVEFELWDYDLLSMNDIIGKFRLLVDEEGEHFSTELKRSDDTEAQYVLNWSVIRRSTPV
jgi:hypothetical protein